MPNEIDLPAYTKALERYLSIFSRAESAVDGIRAELHMIRDDSMLPIYREGVDAIVLQLTVAELALEACEQKVRALWQVQAEKQGPKIPKYKMYQVVTARLDEGGTSREIAGEIVTVTAYRDGRQPSYEIRVPMPGRPDDADRFDVDEDRITGVASETGLR